MKHTHAPFLLALVLSGPLYAADDSEYAAFNDKFRIYIGGFWPEVDSRININGEILPPGEPIDVEETLGVEEGHGVVWGGFTWQIARRHSLEFELFSLERDGGVAGTFDPVIQIGDTTIEGGGIATSYDTSIGRVTYGYSVIRNDRTDLTLSAGLHLANLETKVQLFGNICTPTTTPSQPPNCPANGTAAEGEDVTAPLPHLGGSFSYALTHTLSTKIEAIGFAIELDGIKGSIIELDADITWQPWRNFGMGAGLRYFETDVEANSDSLKGEFNFNYFGPVVYLQTTF